jgi:hypothetical protein
VAVLIGWAAQGRTQQLNASVLLQSTASCALTQAGTRPAAKVQTGATQPNVGGPGTAGGDVNVHAFRYYEIWTADAASVGGFSLTEAEIAETPGGPDTTLGVTVTASSNFPGQGPSNAIDDNSATDFATDFATGGPFWLRFDYGSNPTGWKKGNELRVRAQADPVHALRDFKWRGSDDLSTYTDLYVRADTSNTWAGSETRSFVATASGPVGTALSATPLTTNSPALDSPAIGQVHALGAASIAPSSPALATPAVGQVHALTVGNLAPSSPVLGTPAMGQVHALTATAVATSAPALGTPALGTVHVLAAGNFATAAPALGTPGIGQTHVLAANSTTTSSPQLGTPLSAGTNSLAANGTATSSPALGTPALLQVQPLVADALTTASPVLGSPVIAQAHVLATPTLATAAPDIGTRR